MLYILYFLCQIRTEPRSATYKKGGDGEEEENQMRGSIVGYGGTRVIVKSLATNQVGHIKLKMQMLCLSPFSFILTAPMLKKQMSIRRGANAEWRGLEPYGLELMKKGDEVELLPGDHLQVKKLNLLVFSLSDDALFASFRLHRFFILSWNNLVATV